MKINQGSESKCYLCLTCHDCWKIIKIGYDTLRSLQMVRLTTYPLVQYFGNQLYGASKIRNIPHFLSHRGAGTGRVTGSCRGC